MRRRLDAKTLSLSLTSALALTAMSCSPPPPRAEVPRVAPAVSSAPASSSPASSVIASASPAAVAPPKDWMWEVLGGMRVVYLRARAAEGAVACERYRLEPAGLPASFHGALVLDDDAQPLRVEATYEGNPPQLSAPRAQLGKASSPFECEEGALDWYLSEEACAQGGEPPLRSAGCASMTSRDAREGARRILSGETRAALITRLATTTRLWRYATCVETFVREGKAPSFSGAEKITASFLRAGKPVFLFLETARDDYPELVRSGSGGALVLDETTERNPHRRTAGHGEVALGCCGSSSYDVLDVTADRARLRPRRTSNEKSAPPAESSTWFFTKAACELERAAK